MTYVAVYIYPSQLEACWMHTEIKFPLLWKLFHKHFNNSYLELKAVSQTKTSESSYRLRFKNSKIGELNSCKTLRCLRGGCSMQQEDSGYIKILTVKLYHCERIDTWIVFWSQTVLCEKSINTSEEKTRISIGRFMEGIVVTYLLVLPSAEFFYQVVR